MTDIQVALDFYNNKKDTIQKTTRELLEQTFSPDTMNSVFSGKLAYCNIVQSTIDKITNLWKEAPQYLVNNKDSIDLTQNFEKLNYYTEIQQICALTRLLNTVFVHIAHTKTKDNQEFVNFLIFTKEDLNNETFLLEFDENSNIASYSYEINGIKWSWSKDSYTIEKDKKKEVFKNEYGFLPLVRFQYKPSTKTTDHNSWGEPSSHLVDSNISINSFMNSRDYQANYSGFDMILASGIDVSAQEKRAGAVNTQLSELKLNPSNITKTSNPDAKLTTTKLAMYQANYIELINSILAVAMQAVGLPPDSMKFEATSSAESGVSKIADSVELCNLINSLQVKFKSYETGFLFKLNEIFKANKSKEFAYFDIQKQSDIIINYVPSTINLTEDERLASVGTKLEIGVISYTDAIKEIYNCDQEFAEKKFKEIIQQKTMFENASIVDVKME